MMRRQPAVEEAGEVAVAHLNSAGPGISFRWTTAGRNLEHGQRRGHELDDGWHRFSRASTMMWRKVNPALLVLGGAIVGGIVFMP